MKKSLQEAMKRAKDHSLSFPGLTVWVMDKKGKRAFITVSDWIYDMERRSGWLVVAAFKNGEEVPVPKDANESEAAR